MYYKKTYLEELLSDHSLTQNNSSLDVSKNDQNSTNASTSAALSTIEQLSEDSNVEVIDGSRSQISNIGLGLRLKLGNYAEVLKGMMQQVIDSSGIIGAGFDQDDLTNELFDDEMLSSQNIIDESCDNPLSDFSAQNFSVEVK